MKLIIYLKVLLLMSIFSAFMLPGCITKEMTISNVLERISSGELNEKDVFDFYKKDYDPAFEYHQLFQPCLSHLIEEEKSKTFSILSKLIGEVKNFFNSNYKELEVPDLGIKVKCEVYINKFLSQDYRKAKLEEPNPLKDSLKSCNGELKLLKEEINQKSTRSLGSSGALESFSFKAHPSKAQIEFKQRPEKFLLQSLENNDIHKSDKNVEYQDKPSKSQISHDNQVSSENTSLKCTEELHHLKIKISNLEKKNEILEKQITEKKKIFQSKDDEVCKLQETITKLRLEIIEKDKSYSECENKKLYFKSEWEKCRVKTVSGNEGCAEYEKKLVTKIDELTECEKAKDDYFKKYQQCTLEVSKVKIELSTSEIKRKDFEKKYDECRSENEKLKKKWTAKESELQKLIEKTATEFNQCKTSLQDKVRQIQILETRLKSMRTPIVKSSCQEENEKLRMELITCREKQSNYLSMIEEKNKIIIRNNVEITTCEVEKNNLKTEIDKIDKACKEEKQLIEIKFKVFEEKFHEIKKSLEICKNELKDAKGFKKKYEKCEEASKKEILKNREIVEKFKKEIMKLKLELDKCAKEKKNCEDELKKKSLFIQTCEKEKEDIINKEKECYKTMEEEKNKCNDAINTCNTEKENIIQDSQKKCKVQVDILTSKISSYENEIQLLKINQDCPVKLTKCKNEKLIIENNLKAKETDFIKVKEGKLQCELELKNMKEKYIRAKTNEDVCKLSLEEMTKNWRVCESKKPQPCPVLDQTLITKLRTEHEKCKNDYNNVEDELNKCKDSAKEFEKLIKEYRANKNKCVTNITLDLETCNKNIINMQNKCNEDMKRKVTMIEQLKIQIANNEEKCNKRIRELDESLKKCNKHIKTIKVKHEDCEKNLLKEVEIRKKYYMELMNLKNQLLSCQKTQECLKKDKSTSSNISDKCEKQRVTLLKETFTLKEKITKLEEEKKSIYMSSKDIISSLEKRCTRDISSYDGVEVDIEQRIKELHNLKQSIEGEITNDELKITAKRKELSLKNEEKYIISNEVINIKSDYEKILNEISVFRDKIRRNSDITTVKSLTENLFNKERELKEKNNLVIQKSEKEKEITNEIITTQEQINNINIIKSIRQQNIKETSDLLNKLTSILIEIKKTIEIKKNSIKKVNIKIEKFANIKAMTDRIIEGLENEKHKFASELDTCNNKVEEQRATIHALEMKVNKHTSTSLIDTSLLMRIFEDRSFTQNNCRRLQTFKTKFYKVCPPADRSPSSNMNIESQERIKFNHKSRKHIPKSGKTTNNNIESQHPINTSHLKIESKTPINENVLHSLSGNGSIATPVESQFPLQENDLKIESQAPFKSEQNTNLKVESQFPLDPSKNNSKNNNRNVSVSGVSNNHNLKVESQFPFDETKTNNVKVESQFPFENTQEQHRSQSEEASDLLLSKLMDVGTKLEREPTKEDTAKKFF